ncbi:hypothetical protein AN416_38800 (plasmid) [Paraburkholderia caribensis]|nr:hypothetical protein AN416_38800 [Paraburkholderia caribensis]
MPRCGETLSASCLPLLSKLGIGDELHSAHHLSLDGVRSAWGSSAAREHSSMFHPYGKSVILDRARFDRRLETLFHDEGGVVVEGRIQNVRLDGAEHIVTLRGRQGGAQLKARALVDATGIAAHVARRLGARRITQTRQVALGFCFDAPSKSEALPMTAIVEAIEWGWLFAVPVQLRRAVVWLICDPALVAQQNVHNRALRASKEISRWLGCFHLRQAGNPTLRNASVGKLDQVTGDAWVAVGDAALSLDPLSSSGVTFAMLSGSHGGMAIASRVANNAYDLSTYARILEDAAEHHGKLREQFYHIERRWPGADFWNLRQDFAGCTAADNEEDLG